MREKVRQAARELGLEVEVATLRASTRTVSQAADAVGCQEAQIAKSIVFVADGEPIVCVASGAHRIDLDLLCDALDCAHARQANPDEVRAATGFSPGGVPPFAHGLRVVFDSALLDQPHVWAAGGDGMTVFGVHPRALADCIGATIAVVAEPSAVKAGEPAPPASGEPALPGGR